MADQEASNAEIEAGFGNTQATATDSPMDYVANFDGDEVDGNRYKMGDKLAPGVDPATIAYLVQNGRFTPASPSDAGSPSGGGKSLDGAGTGGGVGAADKLVADNNKDALIELAAAEGVEYADGATKAEIAEAIVAKRNA